MVSSESYYNFSQALVVDFIRRNLISNTNIYDLRCGTGETIDLLRKSLKERDIGIFTFLNEDLSRLKEFENPGCFILNLALQSIRPVNRQDVLNNICRQLPAGGICILSEEIIDHFWQFNKSYTDMHYDLEYEYGNNLSEEDTISEHVTSKDVSIPYTERENRQMLEKAGFNAVSTVFKCLNFASIAAIK
ncbi:hypothetical protein [Shouchella lonarensis]|uniref:tRNA (Cmo5U34)-methyltransferase n=1 Tax=Shouchella lonarensis TaxID=1464122 RepID=A0A1G6N3Z7_9BACI|nr:hypothetical protein [Shouchella lonarensis]SDC61855.1 tRNA (cmo5U34)-methyltransferase [Shouchella lonarensis]